jgi:hypothetical protein
MNGQQLHVRMWRCNGLLGSSDEAELLHSYSSIVTDNVILLLLSNTLQAHERNTAAQKHCGVLVTA